MKKSEPQIIDKKGTTSRFMGLKKCSICGKDFEKDEKFRVLEEAGTHDNDWYAICYPCLGTEKYTEFFNNNCSPKISN